MQNPVLSPSKEVSYTSALPRSNAVDGTIAEPATGLLVGLATISFIAHMLVAGNYGYFRDELYYIADGMHLQLGYVDQPLLMGWLAALLRVTIGNSLIAIHIIPALACAILIVVTGLVARELGGGIRATQIAPLARLAQARLYRPYRPCRHTACARCHAHLAA